MVQTSKEELTLICPNNRLVWDSSGNCECGNNFHHESGIGWCRVLARSRE